MPISSLKISTKLPELRCLIVAIGSCINRHEATRLRSIDNAHTAVLEHALGSKFVSAFGGRTAAALATNEWKKS
ncbi:hypothetical protein [Rhizobium sp. BK491]|uniref:hypothetical protein n=1 Tax=Rhizobium sp. BK491 TaxID=2587009 RepID=UPI0016103F5E|nr:hypothetical protein [Rhizobium sp. BK491]MBB3571742.1 hypothetical protein [Rhizobium sp. BK491]